MSSCMSIVTFESRLRNLRQSYSNTLISQMRDIVLTHKGLPCEFSVKSAQVENGKCFGYRSISNLLIELGFYSKDLQKKQFLIDLSQYHPNVSISYHVTINKTYTRDY